MEDNKAPAANGAADDTEKHKLENKWTLWYDSDASKGWGENLKEVATFDTVEDFWALMNNLQEPSQLPDKTTYSVFKQGIMPQWEDKANAKGGQWRLQLSNRKSLVDEHWLNTLMTTIGEGFDEAGSRDIAGIVVNIRARGDRLSIWTMSAQNKEVQMSIGQHWRQGVLGDKHEIEYLSFEDQKKPRGGARRAGHRSGAKYLIPIR